MSARLKSQEATRRQAQKDLLKLREEVASAKSLSTSANKSAEMETTSLVQVSLHHITSHTTRAVSVMQQLLRQDACSPSTPWLGNMFEMSAKLLCKYVLSTRWSGIITRDVSLLTLLHKRCGNNFK